MGMEEPTVHITWNYVSCDLVYEPRKPTPRPVLAMEGWESTPATSIRVLARVAEVDPESCNVSRWMPIEFGDEVETIGDDVTLLLPDAELWMVHGGGKRVDVKGKNPFVAVPGDGQEVEFRVWMRPVPCRGPS